MEGRGRGWNGRERVEWKGAREERGGKYEVRGWNGRGGKDEGGMEG